MLIEQTSEASPAEDLDVTAAADSSPSEPTVSEAPAKTLLDVVKDVIEAPAEAPETSSDSEVEKPEPEKPEGEAAKAEEPENFEGLPFGRHPRFKQLVEERNTLRAKTSEYETTIKALEGPADQYTRIETFMRENEISTEEVVDLYKFGALFKQDPEQALVMIQPYVADLYQRTGRLLPKDIEADVEEGRITPERAQELSQARARAAMQEERAGKAQTRLETVQTETTQRDQAAVMRSAVLDWDAQKKGSDPDFAAKQDMIADRCAAIVATEGRPTTPEAMIDVLERAHTDVTQRLRALRPAQREMRLSPSPTTSSTASAEPKTLKEAISLAIARGG